MRITPAMMMSQYKNDLNDALNSLNKAYRTAYDYRAFDLPSDDPLKASQTYDIHWETSLNDNYEQNVSNLEGAGDAAESLLQNVYGLLSGSLSDSSIEKSIQTAITGTTNMEGRNTYASQILGYRDEIVSYKNTKYADSYLFGGSNTATPPFTVDSSGQLYYRGINVDTGQNTNGASVTMSDGGAPAKNMQINFGKDIGSTLNGYEVKITVGTDTSASISSSVSGSTITNAVKNGGGTTINKNDLQNYLEGKTARSGVTFSNSFATTVGVSSTAGITISGLPSNADDTVYASDSSAKITDTDSDWLSDLSSENAYVDIGLGITMGADNKVNPQSAYDGAMPGIKYLGFGTRTVQDADGANVAEPCNICSLLTKIANCIKDPSISNSDLAKTITPYTNSLDQSETNLRSQQSQMGLNLQFLSDTGDYLDGLKTNLAEKDNQVEFVEPQDAIEDFYQQKLCYNAALKVGSQVLENSLMDYLK